MKESRRAPVVCGATTAALFAALAAYIRVNLAYAGTWGQTLALSALFDGAGMTFERGVISVSDAGDTRFAPDESGAHRLMTAMDNDLFFSHFFETLGIAPVAEQN